MFVPTQLRRKKRKNPTTKSFQAKRLIVQKKTTSVILQEQQQQQEPHKDDDEIKRVGTIGKYEFSSDVCGEGRFGMVLKAYDRETKSPVAVKAIKTKIDEGVPMCVLRELAIVTKLKEIRCANILRVREIAFSSSETKCFLVTDFAEYDLGSVLKYKLESPFSLAQVKGLVLQLFRGLSTIHRHWIVHRDLKVDNILLTSKGVLQICDFGSARRIGGRFEDEEIKQDNEKMRRLRCLTPNMVSGHYRAPELLLGCAEYGVGVDTWAAGCIFGELLTRTRLFPGTSEITQLQLIHSILGTPTSKTWPEYELLMKRWGKVSFGVNTKSRLREIYPANGYDPLSVHARILKTTSLDDFGFDVLKTLLAYDPKRRASADDVLNHLWFECEPRALTLNMSEIATLCRDSRKN